MPFRPAHTTHLSAEDGIVLFFFCRESAHNNSTLDTPASWACWRRGTSSNLGLPRTAAAPAYLAGRAQCSYRPTWPTRPRQSRKQCAGTQKGPPPQAQIHSESRRENVDQLLGRAQRTPRHVIRAFPAPPHPMGTPLSPPDFDTTQAPLLGPARPPTAPHGPVLGPIWTPLSDTEMVSQASVGQVSGLDNRYRRGGAAPSTPQDCAKRCAGVGPAPGRQRGPVAENAPLGTPPHTAALPLTGRHRNGVPGDRAAGPRAPNPLYTRRCRPSYPSRSRKARNGV